jgi:thymidylate kinase
MPESAQRIKPSHQGEASGLYGGIEGCCDRGPMLLSVFTALDTAGILYCVTHGYQNYPGRITSSDVDILISTKLRPSQLAALIYKAELGDGGGKLVCCRGYYLVLAGKNVARSPCFLELDFGLDYELGGLQFYSGVEVVESRRRYNRFWVPAPDIEFGCYLLRRIIKRRLDDGHGRRLGALYEQDRIGCEQQIARFWGARRSKPIVTAARSGNWEPVRTRLRLLGMEACARVMLRRPLGALAGWLRRVWRRMRLAYRPEGGLSVIFLGPDGAGKSSVINIIAQDMIGAFARARFYSFPPALLRRLLHRPEGSFTLPHELAPRSFIMSAIRAACYWFGYYQLCYRAAVRLHLARSTLVLHDRHLVDALVDPKRYRYSGPMWLLRLIRWFVPKPDLVILLDAPSEVLQARKQEVSFAESERQRQAYRSLLGSMANGRMVDVARPLEEVIRDVNETILQYLTARTAHRLKLERVGSNGAKAILSEDNRRASPATAAD